MMKLVGKRLQRIKSAKYEFATKMVSKNDKEAAIIGIWDDSKHGHKDEPIIVYYKGHEGILVGHNEYELIIRWSDMDHPVRDVNNVEFKYYEDRTKMRQVLGMVGGKYVKKTF